VINRIRTPQPENLQRITHTHTHTHQFISDRIKKKLTVHNTTLTSCAGGRHSMPPPPARLPLTFWPWKWCPSHVWCGLPLSQF